MNCGCIARIEKDVTTRLGEQGRFKKPIKKVEMQGVVIRVTKDLGLQSATANTLQIELEGQKKKETMQMMHSYCPFCGTKIESA